MVAGGLRRGRTALLVLTCTGLATVAVAMPVAAIVARLTSLPLGHGQATITWRGTTGVHPTVGPIGGAVGHLRVQAHETLPNYGQGSSEALGSSLPLGDVHGTLAGVPFTLDITLQLSASAPTSGAEAIGHVTGAYRGEPISATLTAGFNSPDVAFAGTIGSDKVTGTIGKIQRHGNLSTARATFNVNS